MKPLNLCGPALALWLLLLVVAPLRAAIDTYSFVDEEDEGRFHVLTEELRCPKCQNQNLADSDAPIAQDLRAEVHRLLSEGRSDEEIKAYLVERYGEYVLYRPQWSAQTWLLWVAPGALLVVTLVAVWWVLWRRQRSAKAKTAAAMPLDEAEQQRLNALLDASSDTKQKES